MPAKPRQGAPKPASMTFEQSALEESLLAKNGELMTGEPLRWSLGYRSERTFARAVKGGTVPVPLISLPGRRGWFARTRDVAAWLQSLTAGSDQNSGEPAHAKEGAM
jgi:hypothetical protein